MRDELPTSHKIIVLATLNESLSPHLLRAISNHVRATQLINPACTQPIWLKAYNVRNLSLGSKQLFKVFIHLEGGSEKMQKMRYFMVFHNGIIRLAKWH